MSNRTQRRTRPRYRRQTRLYEHDTITTTCTHKNINPTGDPLVERIDGDGITRFGFQNIRGSDLNSGLEVATEIDMMLELEVDVQGLAECNRPWTSSNKATYNHMMASIFNNPRTIYSSAPTTRHDQLRQQGGTLLSLTGTTAGRIKDSGSDKWGRFSWTTMYGKRDEGISVFSCYRCCQSTTGPYTVYQQQYTLMREEGHLNPNPRRQFFIDLQTTIDRQRSKGFRPIVMLDANGDWRDQDKDFKDFLTKSNLADVFFERFQDSPRTYLYSDNRLDYILVDKALLPAVQRVGYLGTHEGADTDHVYSFLDMDEKTLFGVTLNRPISVHSREFLLSQDDKVQAFLEDLIPKCEEHNLSARTFQLARSFAEHGKTSENIKTYKQIYETMIDTAMSSASTVGRKKWGYMRSPELTLSGRIYLTLKQILDCKRRRAPPTPAILKRADKLNIDVASKYNLPPRILAKEVRRQHQALWEAQKTCEGSREAWLQELANDRSRATGEENWETKMNVTKRTAQGRATNRRLTAVTKGIQRSLDRIEIPTHDWFLSPSQSEIYECEDGNFKAYPADESLYSFHPHHTLKVLPADAILVQVGYCPNRD